MYSKSTENLKLPQWEATDHPAFLTDMNQAFDKIDKAVGPQGESLSELQNKVALLSDLSTSQQEDIEQLRNDVSDHGVQIANLQGKVAVLPEIKSQIETANANYRVLDEELDITNEKMRAIFHRNDLIIANAVELTIDGVTFVMSRYNNFVTLYIDEDNLNTLVSGKRPGNNFVRITGNAALQYFEALGISKMEDFLTYININTPLVYSTSYNQLYGRIVATTINGNNPSIGFNYVCYLEKTGPDRAKLVGANAVNYIVQKIQGGTANGN